MDPTQKKQNIMTGLTLLWDDLLTLGYFFILLFFIGTAVWLITPRTTQPMTFRDNGDNMQSKLVSLSSEHIEKTEGKVFWNPFAFSGMPSLLTYQSKFEWFIPVLLLLRFTIVFAVYCGLVVRYGSPKWAALTTPIIYILVLWMEIER